MKKGLYYNLRYDQLVELTGSTMDVKSGNLYIATLHQFIYGMNELNIDNKTFSFPMYGIMGIESGDLKKNYRYIGRL